MKKSILPIFLIVIVILASCNATKIVSSWREPDKQVIIENLHKVLVVALFKDETSRRKAEDEMVQYLAGKGVASYTYLVASVIKQNEEAIRYKIKMDGYDGAVTMRLVDVDKEKVYVPNSNMYPVYYRNFSSYYFRTWPYYSAPDNYATTKTYTVETNVYSIKEDKIIWSGLTETTNPEGVEKMTEEITKVVYKAMIKEGFIK
jgi:hypothetical protein